MSQSALSILFWFALCGLCYIYVLYPLAVLIAARLFGNSVAGAGGTDRMSVVICVYNEANRLPAKLQNVLGSTIAERISEILVASDGSTDTTAAAAASVADSRVRLIEFPIRRGKPSVLNDVIPQCRESIVVLLDARQELEPDAIERLIAPFADPDVGVVSGELMLRSGDSAAAGGVSAYWRYEKMIRCAESRFRSVPGATGALYAIRRELFRPIPANTLLDDVVIPMQAIEQGYRCVLQPGALAWDDPSSSTRQETIRKRRTIAGAAQLILQHPRWLLPWKNPIWWEFVSHKPARLASPLLLAGLFASNVLLAHHPLFRVLLSVQCGFYIAAVVGAIYQHRGYRSQLFGLPLMFVTLNVTTIAALWDAVRGRFHATWQLSGRAEA